MVRMRSPVRFRPMAQVKLAKKISIIGCPASGKTTMSNYLGKLLGIPVYHLDKIFWKEKGGIKQDVFIKHQDDILQKDEWIIDGHFWKSKTFDIRLNASDIIIFFDFPKRIIFWRLLKRILNNYGRERPDMPRGTKTFFDWNLIKYIWGYSSDDVITKVMEYGEGKQIFILKGVGDEKELIRKMTDEIGL
jgi:adenylate kinase family enzyme